MHNTGANKEGCCTSDDQTNQRWLPMLSSGKYQKDKDKQKISLHILTLPKWFPKMYFNMSIKYRGKLNGGCTWVSSLTKSSGMPASSSRVKNSLVLSSFRLRWNWMLNSDMRFLIFFTSTCISSDRWRPEVEKIK